MCAILIHFQEILSKWSITAGIFLRVLSNTFFEFKIPLGYPKKLKMVSIIIIQIPLTAKYWKFHEPGWEIKTNKAKNAICLP